MSLLDVSDCIVGPKNEQPVKLNWFYDWRGIRGRLLWIFDLWRTERNRARAVEAVLWIIYGTIIDAMAFACRSL